MSQMTETEAVAKATALVLADDNGKWAKNEADTAVKHVSDWFKNGDIDAATFAGAVARLSGNHSARRQALERMGFIRTSESDSTEKRMIATALKEEMARRDAKTAETMKAFDAANASVAEKAKK
jgi:hypothetical protein